MSASKCVGNELFVHLVFINRVAPVCASGASHFGRHRCLSPLGVATVNSAPSIDESVISGSNSSTQNLFYDLYQPKSDVMLDGLEFFRAHENPKIMI